MLFGWRWGLLCPVPSLVLPEGGTEGNPAHFLGAGCSVSTSEEGWVTGRNQAPLSTGRGEGAEYYTAMKKESQGCVDGSCTCNVE